MCLVELTTTSLEPTCPLSFYITQHGQSTQIYYQVHKKQMLTLRHPLQDVCDFVSL